MKTESYFAEAITLVVLLIIFMIAYLDEQYEIEDLQKENAILKHQCDSLQVGIDTTWFLLKVNLDNINVRPDSLRIKVYGVK